MISKFVNNNVMSSQVELEKLYDKHDKTQMELRQTHTNLDKYKEETATLEAEVDRFAGRMGKYQVNKVLIMHLGEKSLIILKHLY